MFSNLTTWPILICGVHRAKQSSLPKSPCRHLLCNVIKRLLTGTFSNSRDLAVGGEKKSYLVCMAEQTIQTILIIAQRVKKEMGVNTYILWLAQVFAIWKLGYVDQLKTGSFETRVLTQTINLCLVTSVTKNWALSRRLRPIQLYLHNYRTCLASLLRYATHVCAGRYTSYLASNDRSKHNGSERLKHSPLALR